ncbi:T9SS type A sorting domain-containing protein [Flavobacterium reichenbachii]|uniref:Secretion protein n=1 Tax=Flavobacterium reichenbachii TaxID=362418 RepID=A0A085ZPT9_9FLAO|nr:T9SS type A sorting domain-containing protein [Flavobacterium reichenbachii]KFF06453.1 secretion protein [Flavobacterium reichenbachii]OXB11872.1 T9SS C-terminal target domain-containing protein [Flavobacterium reichenbachii]
MKKILLLFSIIMISFSAFSQIYFGTNSAMYVKNQVLYVGTNINLAANSNLYLRNNSQLVQGTAALSTNSGTGTLSVYQEGSSDNFDYNYWCSPVGTSSGVVGNQNFGITMLSRPTTSTASTAAIALPNAASDGTSNPLAIASKWIYKLSNANNYSQWAFVGSAVTIAPGEGFTMKGTSGTDLTNPEGSTVNNPGGIGAQRYDFRGRPNDGNITVAVSTNNSTLTGNPYPSALDLNAFLLDATNNAATGIAYFWEQKKDVNSHFLTDYRAGYGSYSPISLVSNGLYVPATFNSYNSNGTLNSGGASSGLIIQRRYSPIGQGFVIKGRANGNVTLKNSYRTFLKEAPGSSQFERPSKTDTTSQKKEETPEEVSHFRLNIIINNEFTRQLALAFTPEATDEVDFGIDALNTSPPVPNDINFSIDNKNYIIQGVNFDSSKEIPLAMKAAESTTFKFYIPEIINFDPSQNIFIYDAADQSYHNIKDGMYEVTVPAGVNNERFKLAFTNKTLGVNDETINTFLISFNSQSQTLTAHNPNNINLKTFVLYDIVGRAILTKKNLGTNSTYNFSTSGLNSGIYIAQFLTADNKRISQKVSISNSGK